MGIGRNERIYTATHDVQLRSMSIRPFAAFAEVIAICRASLRRGIADRHVRRGGSPSIHSRHPFAIRSPSVHHPFAICSPSVRQEGSSSIRKEESPFARSPKDVHLRRSLASLKGTPIARRQKDIRLQEVKKLAVNEVLPKKLLRT